MRGWWSEAAIKINTSNCRHHPIPSDSPSPRMRSHVLSSFYSSPVRPHSITLHLAPSIRKKSRLLYDPHQPCRLTYFGKDFFFFFFIRHLPPFLSFSSLLLSHYEVSHFPAADSAALPSSVRHLLAGQLCSPSPRPPAIRPPVPRGKFFQPISLRRHLNLSARRASVSRFPSLSYFCHSIVSAH